MLLVYLALLGRPRVIGVLVSAPFWGAGLGPETEALRVEPLLDSVLRLENPVDSFHVSFPVTSKKQLQGKEKKIF